MYWPAIQKQAIVPSETDPICQSNISWYPHLEGTFIQFSCSVKYRRRWGPTMRWLNGTNEMKMTNYSHNNTVKFGAVVNLTSWNHEETYSCRTFFDQPKNGTLLKRYADNIPVNHSTMKHMPYTTRTVLVHCEYWSHHVVVNVYIIKPYESWTVQCVWIYTVIESTQNVNHFDDQARPVE